MFDVTMPMGEIVEVGSLELPLEGSKVTALVKTNDLVVLQLIIPTGEDVPVHQLQGPIVVHCLQGRISLTATGEAYELRAGQLVYYSANEPFSMLGIEHAVVLVTVVLPRSGQPVELIG